LLLHADPTTINLCIIRIHVDYLMTTLSPSRSDALCRHVLHILRTSDIICFTVGYIYLSYDVNGMS